jgi:hypothetical protein
VNSKPYLNLKSNSKAQNLFCPENHFGLAATDPFPFPFLQHRPASVPAQLSLYGLAQPNPTFVSFLCAATTTRFFATVMAPCRRSLSGAPWSHGTEAPSNPLLFPHLISTPPSYPLPISSNR